MSATVLLLTRRPTIQLTRGGNTTFLSRCLLNSSLRIAISPRHLNRYAFVGMIACLHSKEINKIEFG